MLDALDVIAWESDPGRGRMLYVSRGAETLLGYPLARWLGEEDLLAGIVHPQDRAEALEGSRRLTLEGRDHAVEFRVRHADGRTLWLRNVVRPGVDPASGAPRGRGLMIDVTAARQAQEALRQSERWHRALNERALDVVSLLDAEGRVLYVSPSVQSVLGHRPDDYAARPALDHVHPDDLPRARADLAELQATARAVVSSEYRIRHRDGGWRTMEVVAASLRDDPTVGAVVVNSRDVSARRRAEDALRESEALHRSLVAALDEGVLMFAADGRVLAANAAACRIFEMTPEEFAQMRIDQAGWHAIQEDGSPMPLEAYPVSRTFLTGEPQHGGVMGLYRPDGEMRWLSVNSQPLARPGEPRPYAVIASVTDITGRKRVEAHLRETQKLEAVGRLAGGVAHDFNNLLTAIGGYADLLLADPEPSPAMRADLEQIRRAAERAATLTRQLLAFSRRQSLAPRVLDLGALVSDMSRMVQRLLGEDIRLEVETRTAAARVKADPGQLEQVLLNLAINARDAMPGGGTLSVVIDEVALGGAEGRDAAGLAPGRYVRWSVRDTGAGMDAATRERVFEPFFTTKDRRQGTGLGLASVYGIVRQSGGGIEVESEPGQGTAFHIHLPASLESVAAPDPAPPPSAGPRGRETVLVVEDEAAVRSLMCAVLRGHGYRVLEAADGPAALEASAAESGTIELLVSDVVMPGLQGPELAGRLRARRPGLRVLHVSGYADAAVGRIGPPAAGTRLLQKPFSPQALLRRVRAALDEPAPGA